VEIALESEYWVSIPQEELIGTYYAQDMQAQGSAAQMQQEGMLLPAEQSVSINLEVPQSDTYALALTYKTLDNTIAQSTVSVMLNGTDIKCNISGIWCDSSKAYAFDRFNNEVTPEQTKVDAFATDYVRNCATLDMEPVRYVLDAGCYALELRNNDQDILLQSVQLTLYPETPDYAQYAASYDGSTHDRVIVIEGEDYIAKSDSYVRAKSDINASCYPYSATQKLLNAVDYYSWKTAGQRVVWQVQVEEAGWYNLAFHYTQSQKEGQAVYRNVEIDGKTLFSQMKQVAFSYTGSEYANAVVTADGQAVRIYLTEGKHNIALYTSAAEMAPIVARIMAISNELSEIGLDLQQVAGGNADPNRTWQIETYVPGITAHLEQLRPQLLDRFGLSVRIAGIQQPEKRVQIIKYRTAYDEDPEAFCQQFAAQDSAVAQKLVDAREGLKNVQISDELLLKIAEISVALGIDGHRGDLTLMKAIRAYAALEGRCEAEEQDILKVAHMVFLHRMRSLPFEQAKSFDPSVIEKILHGEAAE
jgi:hypothetical protein